MHLLGFAVGLALLGWCVRLAIAPENQEQLRRLGEAPPGLIAWLLGLSAGSLLINGLILWITLTPVRRLSLLDVVAVNNLANFLNYLPFKPGAVARFVIHKARDVVPVMTIGAWLMAVSTVFVVVAAPVAGVSLWRREIDLLWVSAVLFAVAIVVVLVVAAARVFSHDDGLARIHWAAARAPLRWIERLFHTDAFFNVHTGFAMLAHPGVVASTAALRLIDLGVQGGRFVIAAEMLGRSLAPAEGVLIAAAAFFILIVSPAGPLGTREAGSVGVAAALGVSDASSFAIVPLVVHGAESIVFLAGAGIGVLWLRPDRSLRRQIQRLTPDEAQQQ